MVKFDTSNITYKQLTEESIPLLLQMQEECFSIMKNADLLRRNTAQTLAPCFIAPSLTLGAYYQQQLVAFGILLYANDTSESLAKELALNPYQGANVKLIIVKPDYRGNGLQKALTSRLEEYAKQQGTEFLCATVSPDNSHSISNFTALGYKAVKTLLKYGGLQRVLFIKYL